MEDPDPEWRVMDSLGSLCNYHFEEDGTCWAVGGYFGYFDTVRVLGIFHDDPNDTAWSSYAIGSRISKN